MPSIQLFLEENALEVSNDLSLPIIVCITIIFSEELLLDLLKLSNSLVVLSVCILVEDFITKKKLTRKKYSSMFSLKDIATNFEKILEFYLL